MFNTVLVLIARVLGHTIGMFLVRIQLPDLPGSLGAVATAIGSLGGDIEAIEIVERGPDYAIDHFLLELPADTPTDAIVTAASEIPGAQVLWVSRYPSNWGIASDIATLEAMAEAPDRSLETLVSAAPVLFHSQWALAVAADLSPLARSELSPEMPPEIARQLLVREQARAELAKDWLPGWGESTVASSPLPNGGALILGRSGGPRFLDSEMSRLRHLCALV